MRPRCIVEYGYHVLRLQDRFAAIGERRRALTKGRAREQCRRRLRDRNGCDQVNRSSYPRFRSAPTERQASVGCKKFLCGLSTTVDDKHVVQAISTSLYHARSRRQPHFPVPPCPRLPTRTAPTRPRSAEPRRSAAILAARPAASLRSPRPDQDHPLQHVVPADPAMLRDRSSCTLATPSIA